MGVWDGGLKRARVAWLGHREIFFILKDWCSRVIELLPIYDRVLYIIFDVLPLFIHDSTEGRQEVGERGGGMGSGRTLSQNSNSVCLKQNLDICWSAASSIFLSLNFTSS